MRGSTRKATVNDPHTLIRRHAGWQQWIKTLFIACMVLGGFLSSATAQAKEPKVYQINLPAQSVAESLAGLSEQVDVLLLFPYNVAKKLKANPVNGKYTLPQALEIMLKGTGYSGGLSEKGVLMISFTETEAANTKSEAEEITDMKAKQGILAAVVGFLFGAGGGQGALAQEEGEKNTRQSSYILEEIVVTAQKREQRLIDVPMSVAALSGKDMAEAGITDLQSLSLPVPGLLVSESGTFQRRISIRGIGNTFGNSSLVGIYLDETSVASIPSNQVDLRVFDLERVEVLKGPQGTLYGEGSVGGTIRYITKDPEMDDFAGNAAVDASFTERGDPSYELKSVLNVPLADSLGLRLVGQYVSSGGWIDQPALAKKDINDYELFNIRSKLLWQPSDSLEIKTTAIIHRNNAGAQNTGEDDDGNYSQILNDPSTPSGEDDYDLVNVTVDYDLDNFTLVSSSSYLDADKSVNNWGNQCCFPTGNPGELWHQFTPVFKTSAKILTQEFRAASSGSGPWNWTVGLFYKDATLHPLTIPVEGFVGVPGGTLNVDLFSFILWQEQLSKSWAMFGETSYAITDKLEIGAGIRYFEDDREFRDDKAGIPQKATFDSTNPKVFVSYAVSEDVRLYANAAKGFRSGGFNSAGQPPYEPENVWSYELGSKASLMDGRLTTELALFYSEYDDYQVIGIIPGVLSNIISNAGNAELKGADFSLRLFATDHLELGFNGNYTDTEFKEINAGSSSHAVGDPLDLVPRYGFHLWGNYSFTWFDGSYGFFRTDFSRQGKSNYRNRSFAPDYHSTSDIIDMLNARLGWENDNLSAELFALNLLNEDGFIGPIVIELNSARPRPRTVGVSLRYAF